LVEWVIVLCSDVRQQKENILPVYFDVLLKWHQQRNEQALVNK
jgi:hypothetical protein